MVASRSARQRKTAADAGPLAKVTIDLGADKAFVHKISCTVCLARGHRAWSTHRAGGDNSYLGAMDRWIFHLDEKHPGAEAPCLAYRPEAQARLHERRSRREADPPTSRG